MKLQYLGKRKLGEETVYRNYYAAWEGDDARPQEIVGKLLAIGHLQPRSNDFVPFAAGPLAFMEEVRMWHKRQKWHPTVFYWQFEIEQRRLLLSPEAAKAAQGDTIANTATMLAQDGV